MKSILNYKKLAFWIVAGAILTCIIIAVCFLTTSPKSDRTEDDNSIYEEDAAGLEDNDTEFEPYEKAENSTGNVENHSGETSESVDEQENKVQENHLAVTTEFTEPVNTLEGVKMLMEKYKTTEGDLEIVNNSGRELYTGSAVDIQMEANGKWYHVDQLYDAMWTDEAYIIPDGETTVIAIRWSVMYGELPAGSYRIVKKVMDYRAPEDYDTYYLATEFEIRGE